MNNETVYEHMLVKKQWWLIGFIFILQHFKS